MRLSRGFVFIFSTCAGLAIYYLGSDKSLGENWDSYSWIQIVAFAGMAVGTLVYARGSPLDADDPDTDDMADTLIRTGSSSEYAAGPVASAADAAELSAVDAAFEADAWLPAPPRPAVQAVLARKGGW